MSHPHPNDLPDGIWGTAYIRRTRDTTGARRYTLKLDPADTEWVPAHADILRALVDTGNRLEEALAELARLRDAVWSDGYPWAENRDLCCWFCVRTETETHAPDCPWAAEAIRRAKETHPAADN